MSIVDGKGTDAKWNNLMVDIETLGNKPGCIITQIACVPFNWKDKNERLEDVFKVKLRIDGQLLKGLKVQADTLQWWSGQDPKVFKEMISNEGAVSFTDGLYQLRTYIQTLYPSQLLVWGNSNRFDLGILAFAYDLIFQEIPWYFRNERDVRTLVGLIPEIKANHVYKGTAHVPEIDCLNQIDQCVEVKSRLKIKV